MGFQDDTRHNRIQRETNNDARHNRMQTEEQWHKETQHNAERREMTQDTTEYRQRNNDTRGHNRMQREGQWHKTQQNADRNNDTRRHNRMQREGQWHKTQQHADRGTMTQGDTTKHREGQWRKKTQQNTEKGDDTGRHNKMQRDDDTHKRLTWPQLWSALAEVPKSVWHHPVKSSGTAAPPCWPEHSPTHNTNIQLVPSTNVWSVHKPHKLVSSVSNPCAINVCST